jgi:predicted PurR-regulated permease PerM
VQVQQPSSLGGVGLSILAGTQAAMGQIFTVVILLFFLLTSGDGLLRNLVEVVPEFRNKRQIVEISTEIEHNISGYLTTITIINLIVGVVNGVTMWLFGLPDPLLWGTLAFLLNYIPIIGPICGVMIFFFVGLFSFSTLGRAFIPAGIYLLVHIIEGETVTPTLMARRFTLNPVVVIVSFLFWDWLWGTPGALLSLPILAIFKIVCDRIPGLAAIGHMLGVSERGRHKVRHWGKAKE